MKKKLYDIIMTDVECDKDGHGDCEMCPYRYADKEYQAYVSNILADFFLSKGVVVLPVKPGDTVYIINRGKIKEHKVYFVGINSHGDIKFTVADEDFHNTYEFWDFNIGVCVFLTQEDAITELKERQESKR